MDVARRCGREGGTVPVVAQIRFGPWGLTPWATQQRGDSPRVGIMRVGAGGEEKEWRWEVRQRMVEARSLDYADGLSFRVEG